MEQTTETTICTQYRKERSFHGHTIDVLKSGLQKYTRRAMKEKAMYCAIELDLFLDVKDGARIYTNLVNRLRIIAMEDISVAYPYILDQIYESIQCMRKKEKTTREEKKQALVNIVTLLASPHIKRIRLYSDMRAMFSRTEEQAKEEVKKVMTYKTTNAYSHVYTKEEKEDEIFMTLTNNVISCMEKKEDEAMKWVSILCHCYEKSPGKHYRSNDIYCYLFYVLEHFIGFLFKEDTKRKEWFLRQHSILLEWYKDMSSEEKKMCVAHLLLLLLNRDKLSMHKIEIPCVAFQDYYEKHETAGIEWDEYVIDKHTKLGRGSGKTTRDFALEGAKVYNEDPTFLNALYRKRYLEIRGVIENIKTEKEEKSEKELYRYKMRAQLTTSNAKTDTYFAEEIETGASVVVKGPFHSLLDVMDAFRLNLIKKYLQGLHPIAMKIVKMIPDQFEEVPLGIRAKIIEKKIAYHFLVFQDLCEFAHTTIPSKTRDSKVWKHTDVVDWDQVKHIKYGNPETMNEEEKHEYMIARMFRYLFEILDNAERNFIVKEGKVYSIDEERCFKGFRGFSQKKEPNKKDQILIDYTKAHYSELSSIVKEWKSILEKEKDTLIGQHMLYEKEFSTLMQNIDIGLTQDLFFKEISATE